MLKTGVGAGNGARTATGGVLEGAVILTVATPAFVPVLTVFVCAAGACGATDATVLTVGLVTVV